MPASLSSQVLYNVFESFVTLGGDKVTGVDCVKGIGMWLAGLCAWGVWGHVSSPAWGLPPGFGTSTTPGFHSLCGDKVFPF